MLMKKYINYITTYIAVIAISVWSSGCALLKDGETISWEKVDTACSVIQIAAQTSTYAVCIKNKDLSPIFKAVGEGLIIVSGSANEDNIKPEQIQSYINQLLDQNEWGSLSTQVNGILSALITTYSNFYTTNKDKFKDEVNICARIIKSIGQGLVIGSNIDITNSSKKSPDELKNEALCMLKSLDYDLSE